MPGSPHDEAKRGSEGLLRPCSSSPCEGGKFLLAAYEGRREAAQLRAGAGQRGGGDQAATGWLLPFNATGWQASIRRPSRVFVGRLRRPPPPSAGRPNCSRAAVLIASPARNPSPPAGPIPSAPRVSPVLIPTRTTTAARRSRQALISSTGRNPARTARSGSSSWGAGTPKTPTTASPMNFSTVPP